MNTFFTILITIGAMVFAYMSAHVSEEQRKGKHIPLPWEKD
tara:strand:+ start:2449 stop:2571 length:123 start_codon:yes stop_codon:yes gene_type:complete